MTQEEKIAQVCAKFSMLNDEEQDYVLGVLQALCFAEDERQSANANAQLERALAVWG